MRFAAVVVAVALVPNAITATGAAATASLSPTSGYAGARLVATYSFTPKGSCSAYHSQVSWSFGNTMNWATSPAPQSAGTGCASSTPPTAPPSGDGPGSYRVCATDTSVSSTTVCATAFYTIKAPPASPAPRPPPSSRPTPPAASPSPPSASPSAAPVAVGGTQSPAASPGSAPPRASPGDAPGAVQPAGRTGPNVFWPWIAILVLLALIAGAWRFRSYLMGVFENVEVLGTSGADLETELLQKIDDIEGAAAQAEPPSPDPSAEDDAEA